MVVSGFSGAVGNTPLIELRELSRELGRRVLGKAEFLNPGGSVKDRAARGIVDDAEARGALQPGGTIVEGTAGNTGIALALVANERGYQSVIVVPDDQSREKIELLRAYGSDVRVVPAVAFTNPENYYHVACRIAQETPGAFWANQFENIANRRAHEATTGPEIWEQSGGRIEAFVAAAGTGGTIAGVASALKARREEILTVLCDPMGSALYNYVNNGEL
ncbi:MAG: pyridoxal-phosphate dependent enzyme, partial [Candidatus Cybelea sp.]